jgi:hypothetical protein
MISSLLMVEEKRCREIISAGGSRRLFYARNITPQPSKRSMISGLSYAGRVAYIKLLVSYGDSKG